MAEQPQSPKASADEAILDQQYLRSLSSFEGIILSQIDIKNRLADRLNYGIRAGLIILSAIAVSILVLLLTLSAQVNRISEVVANMNSHFASVTDQMHYVNHRMASMEKQVSLLDTFNEKTAVMDEEMGAINQDMQSMNTNVTEISTHVTAVRNKVGNIALTIDAMNHEVQAMSQEMHRMAKPARTMNKMFPFP
ncbi:MAG: translation initiation factor 2 [Pseudomonadota bacterium]